MLNLIFAYFISYFLTFTGFPLGKVTKEEHKELRRPVNFIVDVILFFAYFSLIYFMYDKNLALFTTIILLGLKVWSLKKQSIVPQIHNLLLFSTTTMYAFKYLETQFQYIALLPMFILMFENSFKKSFNLRTELYSFALVSIIFVLYNVI